MLKKVCLIGDTKLEEDRAGVRTDGVVLCGHTIERWTTSSLISYLQQRCKSGEGGALFFANSNFILQCGSILDCLRGNSRVTIVNDGVGVDIAAIFTGQRPFSENLNGTDFVPALLRTGGPFRVLLYGAKLNSLHGAADRIRAWGNDVVEEFDGFSADNNELMRCLDASKPEVVLVALGNPRQEQWIIDHMDRYPNTLFIAVGALFDFLSGTVPRAPSWVRSCRFEWLYRLSLEPRRLFRRYTTDFLRFLFVCLRHKGGVQ